MSDEEIKNEGRIVEGEASLSASSSLTASGAVVRASYVAGNQTWTREFGQWQIDYEAAVHQREQEAAQLTHDLEQQRKANDLRRLCFKIVVGLLVVVLCVSGAVVIASDEPGTRLWA